MKRPQAELPARDGHSLTGNFRLYRSFHSRFSPHDRDVLVYLPPGYDDQPQRRFPILIMQDGQNLFDGATSFVPGQEWHLDETAEYLIRAGAIEPILIAGVNHTGEHRIDEYAPTEDPGMRRGGLANQYGRLLAHDLLPFLASEFRLLEGPHHTGLGGSSMGGLVALHLGLERPETFGKLAVMSPSLWWDRRQAVKRLRQLSDKLALKIWLDVGTNESGDPTSSARHVHNAEMARDALTDRGWILGHDLVYYAAEGHDHSERSFGHRADSMLRFLFPVL